MKYRFVETERTRHPVRSLCRALGVSVSGYYAACTRVPSACAQRQAALTTRIRVIHAASRATYGAPRVPAELIAQGEDCCKNTVAKLMRRARIALHPRSAHPSPQAARDRRARNARRPRRCPPDLVLSNPSGFSSTVDLPNKQAAQWRLSFVWRPHGDSNPGYRRERAMS